MPADACVVEAKQDILQFVPHFNCDLYLHRAIQRVAMNLRQLAKVRTDEIRSLRRHIVQKPLRAWHRRSLLRERFMPRRLSALLLVHR